jgi:hypothetical protein
VFADARGDGERDAIMNAMKYTVTVHRPKHIDALNTLAGKNTENM